MVCFPILPGTCSCPTSFDTAYARQCVVCVNIAWHHIIEHYHRYWNNIPLVMHTVYAVMFLILLHTRNIPSSSVTHPHIVRQDRHHQSCWPPPLQRNMHSTLPPTQLTRLENWYDQLWLTSPTNTNVVLCGQCLPLHNGGFETAGHTRLTQTLFLHNGLCRESRNVLTQHFNTNVQCQCWFVYIVCFVYVVWKNDQHHNTRP